MRSALLSIALVSVLTAPFVTAACSDDCECGNAPIALPDAGDGTGATSSGATGGTLGDAAVSVQLDPGCFEGFKQCNPLQPRSCGTNGAACDYGTVNDRRGLFCFQPPNDVPYNGACSQLSGGPFCAPGLHCAGGEPGRCAEFCCKDEDCGRDWVCEPIPDQLWTLGTCQPVGAGGGSGTGGTSGTSGSAGTAGGSAAAGGTAGTYATGGAGGAGASAGSSGSAGVAGTAGVQTGGVGGGTGGGAAGQAGRGGVGGWTGGAGNAGTPGGAGLPLGGEGGGAGAGAGGHAGSAGQGPTVAGAGGLAGFAGAAGGSG